MSSNAFAATLDIRLQPSRQLLHYLFVAHCAAAAAILIWIPQWWAVLPMLVLLCGSFLLNYQRHFKASSNRGLNRVIWRTDGSWRVVLDGTGPQQASLLPGTFVCPWLVILHFRVMPSRKRYSLLLCRDNVDAGSFRRLRARLRVSAGRIGEGVSA